MTAAPPLVLKLGGSLAHSGRLAAIVDLLGAAKVPVVVVPGGGAFADTVRDCQVRYDYPDPVAHRLALLAMHQMGVMLAAKCERLRCTSSLEAIKAAVNASLIPVWMPYDLQHGDGTLPADWTVTSDSLAARLCERLGGGCVALVKSCVVGPEVSLSELTATGIVDPHFGAVVARAGLKWRIYGAGSDAALARALDDHPY